MKEVVDQVNIPKKYIVDTITEGERFTEEGLDRYTDECNHNRKLLGSEMVKVLNRLYYDEESKKFIGSIELHNEFEKWLAIIEKCNV